MTPDEHWGPTLESFLEDDGILEEANAYATKMARIRKTNLDRLLDPARILRQWKKQPQIWEKSHDLDSITTQL